MLYMLFEEIGNLHYFQTVVFEFPTKQQVKLNFVMRRRPGNVKIKNIPVTPGVFTYIWLIYVDCLW